MHRWVWEQGHGPIPAGFDVMHLCDNRPCYRLDHLRLGTRAENNADMLSKGRARGGSQRGETSPNHKLTDAQVREIRALRGTRARADVAAEYGITAKYVTELWCGKARRWS
jgi:hypothetical protein